MKDHGIVTVEYNYSFYISKAVKLSEHKYPPSVSMTFFLIEMLFLLLLVSLGNNEDCKVLGSSWVKIITIYWKV